MHSDKAETEIVTLNKEGNMPVNDIAVMWKDVNAKKSDKTTVVKDFGNIFQEGYILTELQALSDTFRRKYTINYCVIMNFKNAWIKKKKSVYQTSKHLKSSESLSVKL